MKAFKITIGIISLFVLLTVCGVFAYLSIILPKYDKTIAVPEIKKGATVVRDRYGIPHITAENQWDLYFALGYCHAQDRLFQMDFYRRAAEGRLAEVFGPDLLDADRYLVTMGFERTAKKQIEQLPPELAEIIDAYCAGINAEMEDNPLPVEFKILGYKPRLWTPVDSQAIGNLISFGLAGWAYKNEILNWLILQRLGPTEAAAFLPFIPKDSVFVTDDSGIGNRPVSLSPVSKQFLAYFINREYASNNWVLSGDKTTSGRPILCEDSHESGPEMPTQWHLSSLTGPGIDITGGMFPGAPIYVFGHNKDIAWGVTNFTLDTQDLYIEKINPDNPRQVMFDGKWVDMEIITDKIPVKGDHGVTLHECTVRVTPHGPIINDVEEGLGNTTMSLHAQGFEPWPLLEGFMRLNTAKNWDGFTDAMAIYAAGPQHFVYADTEGNIGYVGAGKCPIRKSGKGLLPGPGWDGSAEWQGYYPFDKMPILKNPPKGFIGTANNPPVRDTTGVFLSDYWESPWRAVRIDELCRAKEKYSVEDMERMQLDTTSVLARRLVPIMVESLRRSSTKELSAAIDVLASWDFDLKPDSAGAAIFETTMNELLIATFKDELGQDIFTKLMDDKSAATNALVRLMLDDRQSPFFDDTGTPKKETFDDTLNSAFGRALAFLSKKMGNDPQTWRWGEVHAVEFKHVFGEVAVLRPFFDYGPFPFGGGDQTLNRGGFNKNKPYAVDITASIRYIVDFSDMNKSLICLSTGECAGLTSPHRSDMTDLFLAGKYADWRINPADIAEESAGITKFIPKK